MEYSERNETHFVRCLKCFKILKCSRYDTTALLEHIRTDHPEIEIVEGGTVGVGGVGGAGGVRSSLPPECQGQRTKSADLSVRSERTAGSMGQSRQDEQSTRSSRVKDLPEIKPCDFDPEEETEDVDPNEDNAKVIYTRRYNVNSPSETPSPRKRSRYRTSIEKWRPAKGTIYCPKCGCNKRPLIRTTADRAANNSCGAACILGCWPFCFLPCLIPGDNKEYLHCSNCQNFLGLYDRQANCVKPNREFVDSPNERPERCGEEVTCN